MGISKGTYSNDLKIKAIKLLLEGKSYIEIQKLLNLSSSYTVRNCKKKFKKGGFKELVKDDRGIIGRPKKIK